AIVWRRCFSGSSRRVCLKQTFIEHSSQLANGENRADTQEGFEETGEIVVSPSELLPADVSADTCLRVVGRLSATDRAANGLELQASSLAVTGPADRASGLSFHQEQRPDTARQSPHLRPRTGRLSGRLPAARRIEPGAASFFRSPVHLTVSSQLHLEALALGLSRVYCLGRAFRAEKSLTTYHLAEFSMLEAEATELDSTDALCNHVEWLLKTASNCVISQCPEDLSKLANHEDSDSGNNLSAIENLLSKSFARLTFADAVKALMEKTGEFKVPPTMGMSDLRREHELALVQLCGNIPVFVTDFPVKSRPFYCAESSPGLSASFDLLLPGVGEVLGGSVRESDSTRLNQSIKRHQLLESSVERLHWYLELRRFGSAPHGGYGLGVDRFLRFLVGGSTSVKELVPFPRSFHHCPS
uniref:AA_TRNA_LIGASE_II domain-containing protein n=1 Tax=Macrostomum lignano TaxID=282301 RepID=A0A1I8F595_9PLAT